MSQTTNKESNIASAFVTPLIFPLAAFCLAPCAVPRVNAQEKSLQAGTEPIPLTNSVPGNLLISTNSPNPELSPIGNPVAANPTLFGTSGNNATPSIGNAAPGAALPPSDNMNPFAWGPFIFHPHLDYTFSYGTGLNFNPGNQGATAQHMVSPGLSITSKHLSLDYTPSLVYYSKGDFQDTVNHSLNLLANFGYDRWNFGISQSYNKSFSPLVETGTQTATENFSTGVTANYRYSNKTSFQLSASQLIQNAENLQSSRQWSTMDWVDYRVRDPVTVGVGVGGGYIDVDLGSNMTYEQLQSRIAWTPSRRTSFNVNGGVEIRQFLGPFGAEDRINPILGASITYLPFDYTTLSLSADRVVNTSIFENQITEDTSVTVALNQRLLGKLNFGLSGGYRTSDYQGTSLGSDINREDSYTFIRTSLGMGIWKRGTISVSYLKGKNSSTLEGFTYDTDQYSFQLGYRF